MAPDFGVSCDNFNTRCLLFVPKSVDMARLGKGALPGVGARSSCDGGMQQPRGVRTVSEGWGRNVDP